MGSRCRLYKCRISLIVATVQRKPALCGAAGQHYTWFQVGPCQFSRGGMCTLTTAAGCIECRVIWKRKSRWRPGCIGFMHGHVLENALKIGMLGDRQQQERGEKKHGYKYRIPTMKQESNRPTSTSMKTTRGMSIERGQRERRDGEMRETSVFLVRICQMTRRRRTQCHLSLVPQP